jgi:hypothetical protein
MAGLSYFVPGGIEVQTLPWIQTQQVTNRSLVRELQTEIDAGESEAIALAIVIKAERLILDDYKDRIVASRLGLKFTGVLGILLVAKQRGLISAVTPVIDDLIAEAGFRVSAQLYAKILQSARE